MRQTGYLPAAPVVLAAPHWQKTGPVPVYENPVEAVAYYQTPGHLDETRA